FHRAMELTATYQVALERLGGAAGAFAGYPVLTFNANMAVPTDDPRAVAAAIRFTDVTAGSGLEVVPALPESVASSLERAVALAMVGSRDAAVGDFDGDGRTDLVVVATDGSPRLFHNRGQGRFEDVTAASGLAAVRRAGAVAVGDYDNDGSLDLFFTSLDGSEAALYHNRGDGTFELDRRTSGLRRRLAGVVGLDAAFFDFDNDGRLDLVVVGKGGVRLFR